MANEYPFDQTSSQPAQAGNVPKEVSDRFMQELGKHFVTTYTLRISDVEALIEAAQITPSLPNAPTPQAVLDSRAAEHAVSQRIPVNERFLFYRDDEGDYIFEGTRSHEHIAAHGATVEEAYRELLGMLGLRADASPVPSQFDPDDFPEPHMEPVEQGERTEITNEIEIRWRKGFVCAGPFIRENARWTPDQADQFADYLRSAAQSAREQITSAPAPSEPGEQGESPHLCATCHTIHAAGFPCWQHQGTDASGSGPQPSPAPSEPEENGERQEGCPNCHDKDGLTNDQQDCTNLMHDRLMTLAAAIYQIAGANLMPMRIMDTLSVIQRGSWTDPSKMLPYSPEENGKEWTNVDTQSPAPSQPKLPDYTEEGRKEADTWFAGADKNDQQILFMDWKRLERENQQLRQQVKDVDKSAKSLYLALYQCGVVIEFVPGSPKIRNQRAEKAEQQVVEAQALASEEEASKNAVIMKLEAAEQKLAQVREAVVPDFDWAKMEAIAQDELCPECEGQEYCAACLAIKGTRWALKMRETIVALRLQLEKLQKRFDSAWDHIAATSIALDTPVGMNNADYAAQLKLDNAQKDKRVAELEHDVAEWSTVANLGNDRIAAAKAVGVVFTDPGTTCVNQRAEDAEAKVRGLSAKFMCQAELEGGK